MFSNDNLKSDQDNIKKSDTWNSKPSVFPPAPPLRSSSTMQVYINCAMTPLYFELVLMSV